MTTTKTQLDAIRDTLQSAKGYSSQQYKDAAFNIAKELLALDWVPSVGVKGISFNKSSLTTVYEPVNNTPEERTKIQSLHLSILEHHTGHIQIFCTFDLGLGYNTVSDIALAKYIAQNFNGKTNDYYLVTIPF